MRSKSQAIISPRGSSATHQIPDRLTSAIAEGMPETCAMRRSSLAPELLEARIVPEAGRLVHLDHATGARRFEDCVPPVDERCLDDRRSLHPQRPRLRARSGGAERLAARAGAGWAGLVAHAFPLPPFRGAINKADP